MHFIEGNDSEWSETVSRITSTAYIETVLAAKRG